MRRLYNEMKLSRTLTVLLVLALPSTGTASPQVLESIEVVERQESHVEELDVREIRESTAQDLGEALERTANVSKIRKGGIANDVVLRGFSRDNIVVTIDGARLHGACPNRMDPPVFHLDYAEVDRVDVRKGPFDVRNPGSFGGSVEVLTRNATPGTHGEANVSVGSFGESASSAFVSHGSDRWEALAGGALKRSRAYRTGDGRSFTELDFPRAANRYRPGSRDAIAYDLRTAWTKLVFKTSPKDRLELSCTRQEAEDVLYPYLFMDALRDDTDRLNLTYRIGQRGPFSKGLIQWYWNRVEHDMDDHLRCSSAANPNAAVGKLPRPYSMRTLADARVTGFRLEGTMGRRRESTVGLDSYVRDWNAVTTRLQRGAYLDSASIPDVRIANLGLYGSCRAPLTERTSLTCGVRLDTANTEARVDRTDFYSQFRPGCGRRQSDTILTGSVQIDEKLSPRLSLFVGGGHGSRLPDPQERFFALPGTPTSRGTVGNPTLRCPVNDEVDVGLKFSGKRLVTKTAVYLSGSRDYIVPCVISATQGSDVAKSYRNIDARLYGLEASARLSLGKELQASAGLSYTRGQNDTDGTDLPEIPPLRASFGLRHDSGPFFAEISQTMAFRQSRVDTVLKEQETPGWAVTDLKGGYEAKGVKIVMGVQNLFDRLYIEHLSHLRDPFAAGVRLPEPGRALHVSLQYAF